MKFTLVVVKSCLFLALLSLTTLYYCTLIKLKTLLALIKNKKTSTDDVHNIASKWGRSLFSLVPGWNIKIHNKDNLPKGKVSYVIVANHESGADILAIYFLNIQFRWLAKKELFKTPLIGLAMRLSGCIPIKRGDKVSHKQALDKCSLNLKDNTPVVFFPEGTRSTSGSPKSFKKGAFKLAIENNVPVLPMVLLGAGDLIKKGTLCPKKGTVHMKVLELTKAYDSESVDDYTLRVENLIKEEHIILKEKNHL